MIINSKEKRTVMKMKINSKSVLRFASAFGLFMVAGVSFAFGQGSEVSEAEIIKWIGISSGFGLGIAALGCALGQGKMVASAMDGISRNPQAAKDMFVPMILGLAFIEALTIYALVFGFVFKLLVI